MPYTVHHRLFVFVLVTTSGPVAGCGGSSGDSGPVPPPPPPPPAAETAPAKRAHHAIVYDDANGRVLITGGSSPYTGGQCCAMFNDLWAFDGTRWTALPSSGAAMSGMRLAYDSQNRRVISFGGWISGQSLPDLRVLQNNTWTALTALTQMPATEPGFVYDARRNRFVTFGGAGPDNRVNSDTWEFDGSTWARVATGGPPARWGHVMVFDEQRGRTVVFGGVGAAPQGTTPPVFGDLWEFDGSSWREITAPNGPSPRSTAGGTYDSRRQLVIVYGGSDANTSFGDLWAWNGASWSKVAEPSPDGPEPRDMGYVAYDSRRDRVVLFGGRKAWPNDLNDTWEWDGTRWTRIP